MENRNDIKISTGFIETLDTSIQPIEKNYLTIYHGKATDNLARMSSRNALVDNITGKATIDNGELKVVIQQFNNLQGNLGINTNKLLNVAIAQFTSNNTYSKAENKHLEYDVCFSLADYASMLKYDVTPHDNTEAEKKRAKSTLDNARKAIKKDLETLRNIELTWQEDVRGKNGDYISIPLIGTRGIKNGYVFMTFDPKMAEYLARLPLTKYPYPLLGIDARNPNAYNIGLKLAEHFSNDNNIKAGTSNRLKIENILKVTNLPTYGKLTATGEIRHWQRMVQEPLEKALDLLTSEEVLEDWCYTGAKGMELNYKDATTTDYNKYINNYLTFKVKNVADYDNRLAKKITAKKKQFNKKKQDKKAH